VERRSEGKGEGGIGPGDGVGLGEWAGRGSESVHADKVLEGQK
jgi:hypothetical protein